MSKEILVLGKKITSPADLLDRSRNLKRANQTKSDLRTFTEKDIDNQNSYWKTADDVGYIPEYEFENEEILLSFQRNTQEQEIFLEENTDPFDHLIIEGDLDKITMSSINRGESMSASTKEHRGWNLPDTPGYRSKEARFRYNKKAKEGKRKGKMRQNEYRKCAQKIKVLPIREIVGIIKNPPCPKKILLRFTA